MDRKDIAIIVLGIAFVVTLLTLISVSVKARTLIAEKEKFVNKLKQTEILSKKLNENILDLREMLGKVTKEKEAIAKEAEKIKQKLEQEKQKIAKKIAEPKKEEANQKIAMQKLNSRKAQLAQETKSKIEQ